MLLILAGWQRRGRAFDLTSDLVSRCFEIQFLKSWSWSEAQSLGFCFGFEPLSLGLSLEKLSQEAKPGIYM